MLKRLFDGLWQHDEGSALIEYAFVLPILLLLIMGILEYSLVMFGESVLQGATYYAAREGATGYVGSCNGVASASQTAFINCVVAERVAPLLSAANLQIYDASYSGYDAVTGPTTCTTNPKNVTSTNPLCSLGSASTIVVYTIKYPWQIVTPFLSALLGSNGGTAGTFTLQASAVVKNEPYGSH